ncbi:MAG: hypothetical protein HY046_01615 [Acidobacteria bacterium]|nr:hypothetical protein [Acidobacteriota bacterium]
MAPSIAVGTSGIRYGYKWWLFPYEDGSTKYAYGGSGFGGQRLFVLPEKDLIIVFTGWTILNSTPPSREFLNRVLASVKVQGCSAAATAK